MKYPGGSQGGWAHGKCLASCEILIPRASLRWLVSLQVVRREVSSRQWCRMRIALWKCSSLQWPEIITHLSDVGWLKADDVSNSKLYHIEGARDPLPSSGFGLSCSFFLARFLSNWNKILSETIWRIYIPCRYFSYIIMPFLSIFHWWSIINFQVVISSGLEPW